MRRRPGDWQPAVMMYADSISLAGPMLLVLEVCHLKTWQDLGEITLARGDLLLACTKVRKSTKALSSKTSRFDSESARISSL